MHSNQTKATVYALITVLFWATVASAFKIGLRELTPAKLLFIASFTSTCIFLVSLTFSKKIAFVRTLKPSNILRAAGMGFLNPFLYYLILFNAYNRLPAQVAQPINMIWPIILVLLAAPLLKQKLRFKSISALLISFVGVFIISTQNSFFSIEKTYIPGIILAAGSAFIWALYWILNLRNTINNTLQLFLNFLFGTIYLALYLIINKQFTFKLDQSLLAAVYVGFFETGLSFIFWFKALEYTNNTAKIANLIYIAPFLSLIFINAILKEQIYLSTIVGILFIISGIIYQQTDNKNQSEKPKTK